MATLPAWMVAPEEGAAVSGTVEMTVVAKRELAAEVVEIELSPPGREAAPRWEPGAHVDLHLPDGMVRQYSLCGSPDATASLRVAVLREGKGRGGSLHLHDKVEVGDVLAVGGPRNNFPLEPAPRYLFVAGGIGITPIVPMIEAAAAAGADWSLLYGGRTRRSMAFLGRLEGSSQVTVVPEDERGLLDLAAALDRPSVGTLIYCCGPEPLLKAIEQRSAHWPEGALHLERFKPRDDLPVGPGRAFDVVLRRSEMTLRVESGRSILETLAEAGVEVPSSCESGTCGTCETAVLAGDPEHRDSVLTPADRRRGDCMMICCSRSRGERLVLDV